MPVIVSVLRTELLSDPRSLGYPTRIAAGDHNGLADVLNTRAASHVVSVGIVHATAMQQVVVPAEYAVISAGQRDMWTAVLVAATDAQGAGLAISNATLRAQVAYVWSAATTTRANLLALDTRTGSRAEVLFGEQTIVTPTDVLVALLG